MIGSGSSKRLENSQREQAPVVTNLCVQGCGRDSIDLQIRNSFEGQTVSAQDNTEEILNFTDSISNGEQTFSNFNATPTLHQKLANWYRQCNVTRSQLQSLLKILRSENINVPISAKGLLKENNKKSNN